MCRTHDDLGEILERVDIEAWLDREGVPYKISHGSNGTQLNVRDCPVCGSSSWKVYLNAETGAGNCFAGEHPPDLNYSKFSFVREWLGVSNRDVVLHLKEVAREFGWRPPRRTIVETTNSEGLRVPDSIPLPNGDSYLRYLIGRGITPETAEYFQLRYSRNGVFWYRDGSTGDVRYQDYSKRVIIPVFDIHGDLVSFQGRDVTGSAKRKYLFPPGYASTGAHLYNAHNVKGMEHIVATEGAFDVWAAKQALDEDVDLRGVGVVGTFGKKLSSGGGQDQLSVLLALKKHGLKSVTFMWDGELKALNAAADAARIVSSVGLEGRVAVLPQGADPNEVEPARVRAAFLGAIKATTGNVIKMRLNKWGYR